MKRYYIVVGDRTTRDGVVLEGEERTRNHGKPLSFHGARVYCPACKSEGRIVGDGPSRPMRLHGKQVALENDLCICKCDPPPRLIRSQTNASMSFESHEMARMGYGPDGRRLPAPAQNQSSFIAFRVRETGSLYGLRCTAHFDDGSTVSGSFDSNNVVRFEDPTGSACKRVAIAANRTIVGGSFAAAYLSTLTG